MPDEKVLQVAILIWGCVFCAIAALCIFLSSNYDREKRRYLILMESFHHPEQATDEWVVDPYTVCSRCGQQL